MFFQQIYERTENKLERRDLHLRKALNYSLLLLKYRSRSKREIIFRLEKKGFSLSVINKIVDYLEQHNYINDEQFTKEFVSTRLKQDWGPRKISFFASRLGLSQELIDKSLAANKEIYRKKMREIIRKKAIDYEGKNKYQKILRYLAAKGFEDDDILEEMQKIGEDE